MIKKFSFWIVLILLAAIGSVLFIHWKSLETLHQTTARVQPLYERQKILNELNLSLERYRRTSTSFRKFSPDEINSVKESLKRTFSKGVSRLDSLDPTPEEFSFEHQLNERLAELISEINQVEPTLFSRDAYIRPEIQQSHERILKVISSLSKSNEARMSGLHLDHSSSESKSIFLLLGAGGVIFLLMFCLILRNYFVYVRPLKKLHLYSLKLQQDPMATLPESGKLSGKFGEVQGVLNQLVQLVQTQMKDRHKFILDVVSDLKAPLAMLQCGKFLLDRGTVQVSEDQQVQAAEAVRRGLAIFSGSLDDLNDIVDINRLENRLDETTVDLSEIIVDITRMVMGSEFSRRVKFSVPPIPVWVRLDKRRFERLFIQVISKVLSTLSTKSSLLISLSEGSSGSFRGVELMVQDAERVKAGRSSTGGPEQDLLRHWISDQGVSMALAHKVIKAHGGSIAAAGVAGTSVSVVIRLPQERVVHRGLIAPPVDSENPSSGSQIGLSTRIYNDESGSGLSKG